MATVESPWAPQLHDPRSPFQQDLIESNGSLVNSTIPDTIHRHIWIVAGTSCCGKSTVAQKLADQMGCSKFIEGDDYHTAENKAKMSKGIALTDADRAPWLDSLRDLAIKTLYSADTTDASSENVVLTCSALKQRYRQVFRRATQQDPNIQVHFIFLTAPADVLIERIKSRKDHFFSGESMIRSQMEALELPTETEVAIDVIHVDCTKDANAVEKEVFGRVQVLLGQDSLNGTQARI